MALPMSGPNPAQRMIVILFWQGVAFSERINYPGYLCLIQASSFSKLKVFLELAGEFYSVFHELRASRRS